MNNPNETAAPGAARSLSTLWKSAIAILVLLAVVVSMLPLMVQWYLGEWLRDRGVVNVSIDDVDINPFAGRFAVTAISFQDDQGTHSAGHAEADLNWTDLFNQRIRLTELELRDAKLAIRRTDSNRLLLGTIVLGAAAAVEDVEASEEGSGWGFGIDHLYLEDVTIDYRDALIERQLSIDELRLNALQSWEPEQYTNLDVVLSSGDASLTTTGTLRPFAEFSDLDFQVLGERLDAVGLETVLDQVGVTELAGALDSEFQIKVNSTADGGTLIAIDGDLVLTDWQLDLEQQSMAIGKARWSGTIDLGLFGDTNTLIARGELGAAGLRAAAAPYQAALSEFRWQGSISGEAGEQGASAVVDGGLEVAGVELADAEQDQVAGLEVLSWQGRIASASAEDWRLDSAGTLTGAGFSAGFGERPQLLSVAGLRLEVISPEPGQLIAIESLSLQELSFARRDEIADDQPTHVLAASQLGIDRLLLDASSLQLGEILVSDLSAWLEMHRDGSLLLGLPAAEPAQQTLAQTDGLEAEVSSDVPVSDDLRIQLAGVKILADSSVTYLDRSVRPEAELELRDFEFSLGAVDSAQPDVDTPFRLAAAQGRYAKLSFDGSTRPFALQTYLDGKGTIADINMIRLDGYVRRGVGYRVESGTLSADLSVALDGRMLDSSAALTIRKLAIDPLDASEQDEFSTELGVPLGTALALLEDDQETIRLTVPLKGDLADLSVGVGDAIRIVMRKGLMAGMRTAATTYFAPLWPALAATKLFSAASALRFQEVEFAVNSAELSGERLTYVHNMAALLAKRPKVSMTLCGRTVAADVRALSPAGAAALSDEQRQLLENLADARALVIKDALVDQGIESARLVTCTPEFRPEDEGPPRVVFGV
jgi:hypothetical protein